MTIPRTTVVTGARSGMGKATASLLRARGQQVVGADLADCEITADLSGPAGRAHAVDEVRRLCPEGIDAVIACAGVAGRDGPETISVNYFGVVAILEGLAPMLRLDRAPRALAISSQACMLADDPELMHLCLAGDEPGARAHVRENAEAYAGSKLALSLWVRRTAAGPDWAGRGVLLNAAAPGQVNTPLLAPLLATAEGRAKVARFTPLAVTRRAEPEEMAPLLAFLAGPDNRYLVGQTIFSDGGAEVLLRPERNVL